MLFLDIDFSGMINGLISGIGDAIKSLAMWLWAQAQLFLNYLWGLMPKSLPWPAGAPTPADGILFIFGNGTTEHPYTSVWNALYAANYYSPVNLCAILLCIGFGQELILSTWHALRWVISHLPFVGGEV